MISAGYNKATKLFPGKVFLWNQIDIICFFYSKFMLIHFHKIKIQLNENFIPPDYSDLYNLFRLAMKMKPKVSLEIGSGYSTLILSEAIKRISERENEKESSIHYCLEQDKKYLSIIKDYLNLSHSKYVRFIKTDLIIKEVANEKVSICRNFPDISINLFYEDRTDHKKYHIAGDALLIEDVMPDNYTICVDGMISTVDFFKRKLKRNYLISDRGFHGVNFSPVKKKYRP